MERVDAVHPKGRIISMFACKKIESFVNATKQFPFCMTCAWYGIKLLKDFVDEKLQRFAGEMVLVLRCDRSLLRDTFRTNSAIIENGNRDHVARPN